MTILQDILNKKRQEVAQLNEHHFQSVETNKHVPKITDTFRNSQSMNIIAEIKRASPSKGIINATVDPVQRAKQYEALGADAISVLTDQTFFKGSMADLVAVRKAVDLPILCKDFIIDPIQIDQAHAAGATIILLIAAALSKKEFTELYHYATKKGLEVLSEVHDEEEMNFVLDLNVPIIGINNRNLKTFTVNLATTKKLATLAANSEAIIVSESGLKTSDDVRQVEKYGANTILVGETLMRSYDLQQTMTELRVPICKEGNRHAR
ncbi:MAG TPA: indole-3-glycerol phosphate synthase TrpC [Bacillota bacterium]